MLTIPLNKEKLDGLEKIVYKVSNDYSVEFEFGEDCIKVSTIDKKELAKERFKKSAEEYKKVFNEIMEKADNYANKKDVKALEDICGKKKRNMEDVQKMNEYLDYFNHIMNKSDEYKKTKSFDNKKTELKEEVKNETKEDESKLCDVKKYVQDDGSYEHDKQCYGFLRSTSVMPYSSKRGNIEKVDMDKLFS